MSRASDVRDAVATAISEQISDYTAVACVVPDFARESYESGPKIIVRSGVRAFGIDQGPDTRDVTIEVGVVGITPERDSISPDEYDAAQITAADGFDALMESVIDLWTPNGVLARCGMAEHRFTDIEQAIQFDAQRLYADGVWFSMIQVTYQDSRDE